MLETSANSLEGREVVRCSGCLLNQFMTRSKLCRRPGCHTWIGAEPEPNPLPSTIQFHPDAFAIATEDLKVGSGEIGTLYGIGRLFPQIRIDLAVYVLRLFRQMSQRQLSERMNVPRTYISKLENRACEPNLKSIGRIAAALEVSPRQLIEFATV